MNPDHDPVDQGLPAPEPDGPGLFGDEPHAAAAPYRVLARAYRPRQFEELIGQEAMVRILRRAFALGRVAHGFMLTGACAAPARPLPRGSSPVR